MFVDAELAAAPVERRGLRRRWIGILPQQDLVVELAESPAEQKAEIRAPGGLSMDGVWREFSIRMSCLAAAAALARPTVSPPSMPAR